MVEDLILVVVWVGSSFIGASMLGPSNRAGTGALLGLLFGPIGVVVAYSLASSPSGKNRIEAVAIARGELRNCPICAEAIKPEALRCKHCGADVPAVIVPNGQQLDAKRVYGPTDLTCMDCGFSYSPVQSQCPKCKSRRYADNK
jgi:hypothetical protein